MQRVTITIEEELLATVDAVMHRRGYASRSEALRDMIRDAAMRDVASDDARPCVAVLSYVYDHGTRALAQRLTQVFHDRHDITVVGMHVHLDHASCLEIAVLRGTVAGVRHLADDVTAQRGVRHANLHVVPAEVAQARHDHGSGAAPHTHIHA